MAIFYTDSASFNDVSVSGSIIVSGTLSFTENSGGLTGSLLGTATTASYVDFNNVANKPTLVSSSLQINTGSFSGSITTASYALVANSVNALTTLTASNVQLTSITDTTTVNKVLVLDTSTNQVFTTASVGGGGGSGNGFPYDGTITPAVISGSLIISGSEGDVVLQVTGAVNVNGSITGSLFGTAATASYVFPSGLPLGTVSSSTFSSPSQGTVRATINGVDTDVDTGLQTGDSPQFTGLRVSNNAIITGSLIVSSSGIQVIGSALTGSVFSGSFVNIIEMSMAVSGTIAANASTTVTLDMNVANYYIVSASAAGTVTWVVNNPPPAGRVQTLVMEYINGGIKTNNWFTNTRWPAGSAPILSTGTAPDILSFTTDDNGANWRGVLLQRGSA